MDAAASWQAFACTGNILRYLDYKQCAAAAEATRQRTTDDGSLCDHGSGTEGDPL